MDTKDVIQVFAGQGQQLSTLLETPADCMVMLEALGELIGGVHAITAQCSGEVRADYYTKEMLNKTLHDLGL